MGLLYEKHGNSKHKIQVHGHILGKGHGLGGGNPYRHIVIIHDLMILGVSVKSVSVHVCVCKCMNVSCMLHGPTMVVCHKSRIMVQQIL